MEKQETTSAVFDYTSFLGASCKKKWTFIEAMGFFSPIFGTVWKSNIDEARKPEDRLWDQAFNNLSAQSSDESNLISLINLAKHEGIKEIRLMMPYELDEIQIEKIVKYTNAQVKHTTQDELLVQI